MSRYPVSTVWIALPLLLCIHIRAQASEKPELPSHSSSVVASPPILTASIATEPRDATLSAAVSGEGSPKRAHVEQLMEMTNALALGSQMSKVMVNILGQAIKGAHPSIPQKVIDALPETVDSVVSEHLPEFKERMIELYASTFSDDDLVSIIQFYETPVGRKMIRVMPTIVQQGMAIGIQWGRSLAPEIEQRLNTRFQKDNVRI